MNKLNYHADAISKLIKEALIYENYKNLTKSKLSELNKKRSNDLISRQEYQRQINSLLKGRTYQDLIDYYNSNISQILSRINQHNSAIYDIIKEPHKEMPTREPTPTKAITKKVETIPIKDKSLRKTQEAVKATEKETKKENLDELNIKPEDVRKFIKSQEKLREEVSQQYTVYKTNRYAKISNLFVEDFAFNLTKKYPGLFRPLYEAIRLANIKLLSKTYVSMMVFSTMISLPISLLLIYLFLGSILKTIPLAILTTILTFVIIYIYPWSIIKVRRGKIRTELVFATIHMSAIAGSGAQPSKIFQLLIDSKDYPELESELKRIVNNMHLFGYNLTTSLKIVASTTPSDYFKELLNGMVSTIETGGNITKYLQDKADDALATYQSDQKKYLAQISSYSDIYTGILIAAPLLLLVTLAILEKISPSISGISINTLASFGTFLGIPLINIIFLVFLSITQPEF